jgi:hypothetical protein
MAEGFKEDLMVSKLQCTIKRLLESILIIAIVVPYQSEAFPGSKRIIIRSDLYLLSARGTPIARAGQRKA